MPQNILQQAAYIKTFLCSLYLSSMWFKIFFSAALLLFFLAFKNIFARWTFKLLRRLTLKTGSELIEKIFSSFEGPLRVFFVVLGIYAAACFLPLDTAKHMLITKFFRSATVILLFWGLYRFEDIHSILFSNLQQRLGLQFDKILIPFLSKSLRLITVLIGFTIVAQEWNYNISGLIAGLGLGGLAVALAAKDALANIFGGVVIITDKPFTVGDWIKTPSVEGVVEDISFRSTKIRTFANALVTVPNSTLANEPITNWSRMEKRRVTFYLGVTYGTPLEKIKKCVSEIKSMLENHPKIHKEMILVNFDKFGESSLDIFVYFYTVSTVWKEHLQVKEDVNCKIMEILEREGVSVAFPSRSIYFETSIPSKLHNS